MPEFWAGGYPPPPPPKRRTGVLLAIAAGCVVVLAAVLVTAFAWPGWAHRNGSPFATGTANADTANKGAHTTPVTNACTLLSATQVQQVLGTSSPLKPEQQGPIHDPVTDTAGYLCTFSDGSSVLADVEVADYPKSVDAAHLVKGAGTTGTDPNQILGVGDAAETVSNLGHANNLALIAVRVDPDATHLIVVAVNATAHPTVNQLTQLAHFALNAG